jgi:hypothetical protein
VFGFLQRGEWFHRLDEGRRVAQNKVNLRVPFRKVQHFVSGEGNELLEVCSVTQTLQLLPSLVCLRLSFPREASEPRVVVDIKVPEKNNERVFLPGQGSDAAFQRGEKRTRRSLGPRSKGRVMRGVVQRTKEVGLVFELERRPKELFFKDESL